MLLNGEYFDVALLQFQILYLLFKYFPPSLKEVFNDSICNDTKNDIKNVGLKKTLQKQMG